MLKKRLLLGHDICCRGLTGSEVADDSRGSYRREFDSLKDTINFKESFFFVPGRLSETDETEKD